MKSDTLWVKSGVCSKNLRTPDHCCPFGCDLGVISSAKNQPAHHSLFILQDTQSSQQGLHHQFSGSSASAQGAERREEGEQERVTENGRSGSLRVPETSAFERNGSLGAPETSAFERNGSLGVPEMSAFERNGRLKETEMSAFERKENIQISQTSVVVSEASKVLSKVQQARESFELRCALQELETSHVPMERLARPPVDSDTPKYLDTWRDQMYVRQRSSACVCLGTWLELQLNTIHPTVPT